MTTNVKYYTTANMPGDRAQYQRFVVNGIDIFPKWDVDSRLKFSQLMTGIDLKGKRVLDIGCRHGAMCYYAWQAGAARVVGIDLDAVLIRAAEKIKREQFPKAPISLSVCKASRIDGNWDVIIMSALWHWLDDKNSTLCQIVRCLNPGGVLAFDAWVCSDGDACYHPKPGTSPRIHWIPSRDAIKTDLRQYFADVQIGGQCETSQSRDNITLQCRRPLKNTSISPAPEAWVLYGWSGVGKTATARFLERGRDFAALSLDPVFHAFYYTARGKDVMCGPMRLPEHGEIGTKYSDHELKMIEGWLASSINRDVAIEGGELRNDYQRNAVVEILQRLGWKDIRVVELNEEMSNG